MARKPTGRPPGRPRKTPPAEQPEEDLLGGAPRMDSPLLDGLDLGQVAGGVSAAWLGHVFEHDKNTIKKKLARCPISGMNRRTPLYRIKDAAEWLVKPKVDIMTYLKGLRQQDVPIQMNKDYWAAMRTRQGCCWRPVTCGRPRRCSGCLALRL